MLQVFFLPPVNRYDTVGTSISNNAPLLWFPGIPETAARVLQNFFILEIPVRFVYKETRGEREV
jgi:hypothetical protein